MAEEMSTEEFCARFHFLYCAPVLTFIGSKTKSECMFKDEFIEQSWKKELLFPLAISKVTVI